MAICYVKAYFDWIEQTAALSDAEKGRLFIAILEYARSGLTPDLCGRESLLFPTFRAQLDRDKVRAITSAENGKKGGRPKTKQNLTKPNQTKANLTKGNKEKEKEKDYDKDKGKLLERENKKRENPEPAVSVAAYSSIPELNIALADFVSFRAEIGKPMTDRAIELLISKLRSMTGDVQKQIEILNQSIINRWQGVFPLKQERQQQTGKGGNPFLDMINEEAYND